MREIPISKGNIALVDDEDYELVSKYSWSTLTESRRKGVIYACAGWGGKLLMHRLIMRTPLGLVVNHSDGDGLNNQKINLENCTQRLNLLLGVKYSGKGVWWDKNRLRWVVRCAGQNLGRFKNLEDALVSHQLFLQSEINRERERALTMKTLTLKEVSSLFDLPFSSAGRTEARV